MSPVRMDRIRNVHGEGRLWGAADELAGNLRMRAGNGTSVTSALLGERTTDERSMISLQLERRAPLTTHQTSRFQYWNGLDVIP